MRAIGVGYDGSGESEHALGVARALAEAHHTRLSAFTAVFFPGRMYATPAWPDHTVVEEQVAAARDRIAALEGVEPHSAYGDPGEELARYSDSLDLLVIGSRGYGPVGRLVHGSTAQRLARTAHCPLLVLTRAARQAAGEVGSEDQRKAASATS
jgi:nucleotide-binding universal stress UspA family protein